MTKNIVLVGFMGTGKSTVGKRLAKALGWEFIDTDWEVEEVTGLSIPEIFKRHGETRFRSEETLVVKKIITQSNLVIATGGGTIIKPDNRLALARSGVMIHLYAPLEVILDRIGHRNDRPLLKTSLEEIEALWLSRQCIYDLADYTIDTSSKGINEVVKEILEILGKEECLDAVAED